MTQNLDFFLPAWSPKSIKITANVSEQIFRNTTNLRQLCPRIFEDIFFYLILRDNLKNLEEKSLH